MWTRFRSSSIRKDRGELSIDSRKSLNINKEYVSALRTQSYVDFLAKAQSVVKESPFPSFCHHKFSEILLEPGQETIPAILDSSGIFSRIPELKDIMLTYFELSAEASQICSHLLKNINHIQSNYEKLAQHVVNGTIDNDSELNSFIIQSNPFSTPSRNDFKMISDKHSMVLHHLKSQRKKVARKIKLITCINKASGVCITAACGLIAISAMVIAAHTLTALVMGPAIFSFPFKGLKKKLQSLRFMRSGSVLRKIRQQLDVAAKGTYILNRDFDTMSRLVVRIHDEVEHNKNMIQFWLEKREDDKFCLQVMKELKKRDNGFRKQVEELEEHVYLCLLTINRSRGLVVKEMTNYN